MSPLRTLRRFRHTATTDLEEWAIRDDLRAARRALLQGRAQEAWGFTQRAHDASQNSPLLHTRAHLGRLIGWTLQRRPGAALREVPLVFMATPAAMVRRGAGLLPGEDGGVGLIATWRLRRDPPGVNRAGVNRAGARPLRVSDEG